MENRFLARSPPPTDNDASAAIGFNEESSGGALGLFCLRRLKAPSTFENSRPALFWIVFFDGKFQFCGAWLVYMEPRRTQGANV